MSQDFYSSFLKRIKSSLKLTSSFDLFANFRRRSLNKVCSCFGGGPLTHLCDLEVGCGGETWFAPSGDQTPALLLVKQVR